MRQCKKTETEMTSDKIEQCEDCRTWNGEALMPDQSGGKCRIEHGCKGYLMFILDRSPDRCDPSVLSWSYGSSRFLIYYHARNANTDLWMALISNKPASFGHQCS